MVSSVAVLSPGRSSAQTDNTSSACLSCSGFISFTGLEGEAMEVGYLGWSEIQSFNQSIAAPSANQDPASQRRAGRPVFEDILVVKRVDKTSPKIAEAVATGKVFPKVEIHHTAPTASGARSTYYVYELKNVQVTSYNIGTTGQSDITPSGLPLVKSGGPSDLPMEQITLNFEEIKVTYTETDSDGKKKGNVEYAWKVEEAEPK